MITRKFDKVNVQPSLLGFGTMRMPKLFEDKPDIDYELGEKMIDYAYAHGVNYYDTAYPYHEQKAEAFIGHALKKYPRDTWYLADKLPMWFVNKTEDVQRLFAEQLERCQVEYFDFYLCHAMGRESFEKMKKLNVYEELIQLKKEGKIRHLGFSFHDSTEVLKEMIDAYEWDFVQIQLNYLDWERQDAKGMYEALVAKNLPVVVMEPVRGGTLATLSPDAVDILKTANPDVSTASWAIRFVASNPGIMTVLSGMSTMEQVVDNVSTITDFKPMTDEEIVIVNKAKDAFIANTTIPCTGCRYCMDCPAGVDIPGMFKLYNDFKISKFPPMFIEGYEAMAGSNAEQCVACGACVDLCPQSLPIPDLMAEIRETVANLKK